MLCFSSVKNRKRTKIIFDSCKKPPNFVAKTDKNKKFRTHFTQFRATHYMSLQNALYSIPSVQRSFCHYERKNGDPSGY